MSHDSFSHGLWQSTTLGSIRSCVLTAEAPSVVIRAPLCVVQRTHLKITFNCFVPTGANRGRCGNERREGKDPRAVSRVLLGNPPVPLSKMGLRILTRMVAPHKTAVSNKRTE